MKKAGLITTMLIEQDKVLRELKKSLQREFEYFITVSGLNEKALIAKKNQISLIDNELKLSENIFNECLNLDIENEKFHLIIIKLGLNTNIVNRYLSLKIEYLKHIVNENIEIDKFLSDLKKEIKPEIKTAKKPILGLNKLKEMAKNAGKSINY